MSMLMAKAQRSCDLFGLLIAPLHKAKDEPMSTFSLPGIGLLLGLAAAALLPGQQDAREIVRQAVAADERNWKIASSYECSERVDDRRLDAQGQLKSQDVESFDVVLLDGSPYRRLAGRNDLPLPAKDEKRQQERLAAATAARRNENAEQRARRVSEYVRRPDWQREAWRELPDGFDFRIAGEEVWNSGKIHVIEALARPGYRPQSRTAKVFPHLRVTLWIHSQDYYLVRAKVEVIDTIAIGLVLVRLAQGSQALLEQTRLNEEVWILSRVHFTASARLGLLKVRHMEQEILYRGCREPRTAALTGSLNSLP